MNKTLLLILALSQLLFAQTPELEVVSQAYFPGIQLNQDNDSSGVSDLWGYVAPDGVEYILAGTKEGTAIIKADDMTHLFTVPGPTRSDNYYHRDIKVFRGHAFVSGELRGFREGIQVLDLTGLPDSVRYVKSLTDRLTRVHNLSIDTTHSRLYFTYGNGGGRGGVYDIFSPADPIAVAFLPEGNTHDLFARNDTLWMACSDHFSVWDMADPTNPIHLIYLKKNDFGYCHSIWPTKNGKHFITTEETPNKTVKIWAWDSNSAGYDSARLVSEFLGKSPMAHNVQIEGDSLYISHYTAGVMVMDISDPANPVPVAQYDTYPHHDGDGYLGCWGIYPHSPSGYIYSSDMEGQVIKFRFAGTSGISPYLPTIPVMLFPNPGTSPALGFRLQKAGKVRSRWIDAQGRELFQKEETVLAGDHRLEAEAAAWPSGTYFYSLRTPDGIASGSWIKE